jgi:hypothetical protein
VNLVLQNTIARFVLVAYVVTGILLEVGHRHPHDFHFGSNPVLSSHTCGDKEIHVPLDKRRECLACTLSSLRVSTAAASCAHTPTQFAWLAVFIVSDGQSDDVDILYSGKRGPPLA